VEKTGLGTRVPKFKSSGKLRLAYQILKEKALLPTETSVTIYPSAHCSIAEDLDIAVACTHIRSSVLHIDMNMK
jgi:hypothetical protein